MSYELYKFKERKIDVTAIPAMEGNTHVGWRVMVDGERQYIPGICSKRDTEGTAFKRWRDKQLYAMEQKPIKLFCNIEKLAKAVIWMRTGIMASNQGAASLVLQAATEYEHDASCKDIEMRLWKELP